MDADRIMTIEEVRAALRDRRLVVVASEVNLSYPTVKAIVDGRTSPKYETVKLLSDYLQRGPRNPTGSV